MRGSPRASAREKAAPMKLSDTFRSILLYDDHAHEHGCYQCVFASGMRGAPCPAHRRGPASSFATNFQNRRFAANFFVFKTPVALYNPSMPLRAPYHQPHDGAASIL